MKWCATSVRNTTAPINRMAQPNCNDQIAARAFGAEYHYSSQSDPLTILEHDAVFVTMQKIKEPWEPRWMDMAHRACEAGKKVVLFQEAETPWATTRSWEEQKSFIELLGKVDLFLTHNQRDIELWGTMTKGGRSAFRWRTCLDLQLVEKFRKDPETKFSGLPILCGSSYDERANGLTGLVACKGIESPSWNTHYGEHVALWHQNRSTGYEDRTRELPYLLGCRIEKEIPHSGWFDWLEGISGAYIAVHPMPAASAGRDQIAFAALGIPCIGAWDLDIQRELFPSLTIEDIYNPREIRNKVVELLGNPCAYRSAREHAMETVAGYDLKDAKYQADLIKAAMGWV